MSRIPSHPRIASAQVSSRWLAELSVADSIPEVIAVARSFVETWSAPELLRLPFYCRPGRIVDAKQIQELAFLLERAQADFTGRLIDGLVLDRMYAFFAEASSALDRIAESHGEMPFLEGFDARRAA
jgi:hypothetical protein